MIVVPYVAGMLRDQTRDWATDRGATLVELHNSEAYWRLLAQCWGGLDDLVVVEQDIVPADGVVDDMLGCDRLWCASPYWAVNRWLSDGLGCTRFSAALKAALPDALEVVGRMTGPDHPAKHWALLDRRLSGLLWLHGHAPHEHERSIHLHDYGR